MKLGHKTVGILILAGMAILPISENIIFAEAQQNISITVNKDSFSSGETVSILGKLENAEEGTPIAIEVRDQDGQTLVVRTVSTDAEGNYKLEFKIPSSAKAGELKIFTSAEVNGEKISGSKTVTVAASQQGSNSNGAASTPSKCLIATAAFGSELSPQVQFLRSFRDNHILATTSGSSFMNVFDAWYYSFSPSIADYERNQPWLQQTVKVAIYPLLGILQVSEKAYLLLPGEYGSLAAGLAASSLIGAVYASPIVLSFKQIRRFKLDCRIAGIIIATSVTSVLVSLSLANQIALMITTSILVVSTLSVAAIVTAKTITRILEKKRKWK